MNTHEFIKAVFYETEEKGKLNEYKKGFPIGKDENGEILLAQKREQSMTVRNTCVTGVGRTDFIRRMIMTLSCLYEKDQACFFVLSPRVEYGELLRLQSVDITIPYLRSKEDLDKAMDTLKELMRMRTMGAGYPRLFLVLDGLNELSDTPNTGELEEYCAINDLLVHKEDVDIITGLDLTKSIFAGHPGAFLGSGNCLVTTHQTGEADVTYVEDDFSLTAPTPITYPCEPSVVESIALLNTAHSNE